MDYDIFILSPCIQRPIKLNEGNQFSYKLQIHIENSSCLIPDHIFLSLSRQNIMTTTKHVKSF